MNRRLPTFAAAINRVKISHFTEQGFDINGIIHVGANDGEEIFDYLCMGIPHIVGIEPLSSAFDLLEKHTYQWPPRVGFHPESLYIYNIGLHDEDKVETLKVASGDGKGSTILGSEEEYIGTERVQLKRFDSFVRDYRLDMDNYDTLVLDTQGNEHQILTSMGDLLHGFKFLSIELSLEPIYDQELPAEEIASWLDEQGFTQDSRLLDHNDVFFVRNDLKSSSRRLSRWDPDPKYRPLPGQELRLGV